MKCSIKIPVKPSVKKYIEKNKFLGSRLEVTERDPIGMFLVSLLRPHPIKYAPLPINGPFLKVTVTPYYFKINKVYINYRDILRFNRFVERLILRELYQYVDNAIYNNVSRTRAIQDFIDKYDFEESELTFDKAKQFYFRTRSRLE